MSESWYVINPQPTMLSNLESDEWNDWVSDGFDELLKLMSKIKFLGEKDEGLYHGYLCKGQYDEQTETFETEVETQFIIQGVSPDAYTQGWKRQILTRMSDRLANYKYIKAKNTQGNWRIYLIMTSPDANGMYTKAAIHQCNYILKWQNKETLNVYSYPCSIENASQYNTGENNNKNVLVTGFSQLMAWIPFDSVTLDVDRSYRFFIDYNKKTHLVYRTTSMSHVDYSYLEERIIRLTFTEDMYNPDSDNLNEWICDYVNVNNSNSAAQSIDISYVGSPTVRIGGRKTFTSNVDDVIFSILCIEEWKDKITVEKNENKAIVRVASDSSMVGGTFKLVGISGNFEKQISCTIKSAV